MRLQSNHRPFLSVLKDNSVYRVNDVVERRGIRWAEDRSTILSDYTYRNTLLYSYLIKKRREPDLRCFRKVATKLGRHRAKPGKDDVVIHVRLGDVMDPNISGGHRSWFERSLDIYANLRLGQLTGCKRAIIVTALHFGSNSINGQYFYSDEAVARSNLVLDALENRLSQIGLEYRYHSTQCVDDDICFMVSSNMFVKSTSRLSSLIAQCLAPGALVWSPPEERPLRISRIDHMRQRIQQYKAMLGQ